MIFGRPSSNSIWSRLTQFNSKCIHKSTERVSEKESERQSHLTIEMEFQQYPNR